MKKQFLILSMTIFATSPAFAMEQDLQRHTKEDVSDQSQASEINREKTHANEEQKEVSPNEKMKKLAQLIEQIRKKSDNVYEDHSLFPDDGEGCWGDGMEGL